jgi:hypothetical protein
MSLHERKAEKPQNEVEKKLAELKRSGTINAQSLNNFYYPNQE